MGILKSLKTCPDAYAIFETEAARDAAVESAGAGGVEFNGNTLKLNASRGLAPGELGIAGDHFLGQEINIELLGMVDYDLHQYGVFMFIKQINQQININYGVFMFIKLGFTTVDGKKNIWPDFYRSSLDRRKSCRSERQDDGDGDDLLSLL